MHFVQSRISTVDVYANGEVWLLHYESEVSKMKLDVGGRETSVRELAGGIPEFEWCVPVSYYNLQNSTSRDDLDTEGSH